MTKRNRTAGNQYERDIVKELKELGYTKAVTSRNESRTADANKIDIVGLDGHFAPQCKNLSKNVNYHKLMKEINTDMPKAIFHKRTEKSTGGKFMTKGEYVILEKDFFYKLLETYK
ncbi:hypothetical protein [uncultured Ilyobacter sp.]|uniref:hypothetical protein n=1 Tax=uncultured Ilyobacter sp. TaxID=544433 RepID=UPI002AA5E4FA|nr:hypothetical protein [uncultured Ilyobacter sp.]